MTGGQVATVKWARASIGLSNWDIQFLRSLPTAEKELRVFTLSKIQKGDLADLSRKLPTLKSII